MELRARQCTRCGGSGQYRAYGKCFACNGTGHMASLPTAPEERKRLADRTSLNAVLASIPASRYALPNVGAGKAADGSWLRWDFFEVVERRGGRRYLNRLVGAPGDWSREWLSLTLQTYAAGHIAEDPRSAAIAYAQQHGRCAVCDAPLSNPESIARSMGPICAKRFA